MAGNPYCWIAGFSYDICCVGFGPGGNPACWDGHFTFARCCVAPGEDSKVAAYVSETSARYQRVGLYKDYVPGKDCWDPPLYSHELCCDLTQGFEGRKHCWDGWRLTFERCCVHGEDLDGRWQLPMAPKQSETEEDPKAPAPVGRECWTNGYSFRACCRLGDEEEDLTEDRASCWDGLHTEERCCRGLVAPPETWRAVPRHAPESLCLEAVLARPLKLATVSSCEGRFFYVAQLGKPRLRMDYDTTALPWFLVPRWNTSAWGEYITHFGPQGVLDHKMLGGLCLPSHCDVASTARFLAPRMAPWWRFPLLEPWPLNGSHVLLPPPLAVPHGLYQGDNGIAMWMSKSSCEAPLAKPDFCEAFWEFGLLEWRPWHSTPSLRMAALLSALLMVLGLVVVGKQRPTAERNSRADLLRVLLTLMAVWTHTFSHGSWLPLETSVASTFWFTSQHLTYKVNLGFVVLATQLRLGGSSSSRFPVAKAALRRWVQLGPPLCLSTFIYLYIFVEHIPMNNLMKSSGLHRWYSEKRLECRRPAHLVLSLLLLHEPITGNNSPCHNMDIFESQFLLDLLVVFLLSALGTSRRTSMSWLLWYASILWRYSGVRSEENDWAYAYSHRFRMLLPSALCAIGLWGLLPCLRGAGTSWWYDMVGLALVSGSCLQDQLFFGDNLQVHFKPLQRAVIFNVSELLFVLGFLLLLRPSRRCPGSCIRLLSRLSLGVNVSNLFVFHFIGGSLLDEPLPMSFTMVLLYFALVYVVSCLLALMLLALQLPLALAFPVRKDKKLLLELC